MIAFVFWVMKRSFWLCSIKFYSRVGNNPMWSWCTTGTICISYPLVYSSQYPEWAFLFLLVILLSADRLPGTQKQKETTEGATLGLVGTGCTFSSSLFYPVFFPTHNSSCRESESPGLSYKQEVDAMRHIFPMNNANWSSCWPSWASWAPLGLRVFPGSSSVLCEPLLLDQIFWASYSLT